LQFITLEKKYKPNIYIMIIFTVIMRFPNFQNKYPEPSFFSPEDYWNYKVEIGLTPEYGSPEGVIFWYLSSTLRKYILDKYETTKIGGFLGEMYLLHDTGNKVAAIGNFGLGASAAVYILEDLIAYGVKKFVSIGIAGTLQKEVNIGDIVVCEKAVRDEGTSYHYVKPSKYAYASEKMTEKLKRSLETRHQKYIVGTSWTTDAPYRETIAELKHYQKEGVVTVDMEASALFAVARYRNVEMGAMFTISDSMAELTWNPRFYSEEPQKKLKILLEAAVDAFLKR